MLGAGGKYPATVRGPCNLPGFRRSQQRTLVGRRSEAWLALNIFLMARNKRIQTGTVAGGAGVARWRRSGMLALLAAGVVIGVVGQRIFRAGIEKGGSERGELTVASAQRGEARRAPWGQLEITPLVLERPDEMFSDVPLGSVIAWNFPNHSREQLSELLKSCGLSSGQQASLLETNRWQAVGNGWRILPAPEVVRDLSEAAREKIYTVLARSPDNAQAAPFVFRADQFERLLAGGTLTAEQVELARRLSYRKDGLQCFADGQLFAQMTSSNDTRQLFKSLLRVPTMTVKLHLTGDSDLDALVRYWGLEGRERELRPLLHSLARAPGGGRINVADLLPAMPRLRLYTYPTLTNSPRLDCFWTSFSFFGDQPGYRLADMEYTADLLARNYTEGRGEKRFGDLLILVDGDVAEHACIYIADDIYFTKNGKDRNQPWVFMHLQDIAAQFPSGRPQQWKVFRRKAT